MALEYAVEGEAGEEALGRVVDHRQVLAAQVLAAAEPILRAGATVLVVALRQELPAADVRHEGATGLGQGRPEGLQVGVGRREVTGRIARHHHGSAAHRERLAQGGDRALGVVQGYESGCASSVMGSDMLAGCRRLPA